MNNTNAAGVLDNLSMKYYNFLYSASIATEATQGNASKGGILVIGLIIVVVGMIGFIITKHKN